MNWHIRPMEPGDKDYVLDTWRHFARSKSPGREMSKNAFSKYLLRICAVVAACPTLVCHDEKDRTLIYGFITFDPILRCLHMVYVRKPFRQYGLGTQLLSSALSPLAGIKYSMHVRCIEQLSKKWGLTEFDPYLLEGEI